MDPSNEDSDSNFNPEALTRSLENYQIACIKKLYYSMITNSQIFKNPLVIEGELRRKSPENVSNFIFNKIENRVRDLGPCEE